MGKNKKARTCKQCKAACCKVYNITVTFDDTIREPKLIPFLHLDQEFAEPQGTEFAIRFPCPFLGPDNKCKIYDTRPEVCRIFGSKNECKKAQDKLKSKLY